MERNEESVVMGSVGSEPPSLPPPPLPPPPKGRFLGRAWAVTGIVLGFLFYVVPGIFAIRSFRRWRSGKIPRPTFAWTCAWIGLPLLALGIYSVYTLYHVPVVKDDFSNLDSGWPEASRRGWSTGYFDGTYRIQLHGSDIRASFLIWDEGRLPNVAVEADARVISGVEATLAIGCVAEEEYGYLFALGPGETYMIGRIDEEGITVLTEGPLPAGVSLDASNRIRGECRAGSGPTSLAMYVNGMKLAEATEAEQSQRLWFTSIVLLAATDGPGELVDVGFDDVLVIGIEP